jgi:D-cysteine desulfhydrase
VDRGIYPDIVMLAECPEFIEDARALVRTNGEDLLEPHSQPVELDAYMDRLLRRGNVLLRLCEGTVVSLVAYCANDLGTRVACISLVLVSDKSRHKGVVRELLDRVHLQARKCGMRAIQLHVHPGNASALRLYLELGYCPRAVESGKLLLRRRLYCVGLMTPVHLSRLFGDAGIQLRVKRDDVFPASGGGNKARKAQYIVTSALDKGYDTIVTNGGLQSNHVRATALLCAQEGIDCHVVLHSRDGMLGRPQGNQLLTQLTGVTVESCLLGDLADRMDRSVAERISEGKKTLYLWGGGHCLEGSLAYLEAAEEAQEQCGEWVPDFLVLPSGTGTTQAGLIVGYRNLPTKVLGISVARDSSRAQPIVSRAVTDLLEYLSISAAGSEPVVLDEWVLGGYEGTSRPLWDLISHAGRRGLILDPTYTGKALLGLKQMIDRGTVPPGSRVLFWHTGGLPNLMASDLPKGLFCEEGTV